MQCKICTNPIKKGATTFCSKKCYGESKRGEKNRSCEQCLETFHAKPRLIRIGKAKFCSKKCFDNSKKGKPTKIPHSARARGEKHHMWKGGKSQHGDGYSLTRSPHHPRRNNSGYILEHIAVVEESIGKELAEGYVIHHINGKKNDNRPENLYIFETTGEHTRHHMSKEKEILTSNLSNY